MLLEVDDLHAGYGHGDVLTGISFAVEPGEVVCLLGRNGAGKSTTMKSIMRLVLPTRGRIRFRGNDLAGLSPHRIALMGVGYVPEDRRVFPKLTVEENLRVTRRSAERAAAWSLAEVYAAFPILEERRGQAAGTLSGGEQQMLAIARTLMGGPELLLLDEPSEGLAPLIVRVLVAQIRALKERRLTILLSEQNQAFARELSDRIYVIDKGQIRFAGQFRDLEKDPELKKAYLFVATGAGALSLGDRAGSDVSRPL